MTHAGIFFRIIIRACSPDNFGENILTADMTLVTITLWNELVIHCLLIVLPQIPQVMEQHIQHFAARFGTQLGKKIHQMYEERFLQRVRFAGKTSGEVMYFNNDCAFRVMSHTKLYQNNYAIIVV